MPLRHCGKNEFGIYSRIRCKIFRLKPNANYLNRPINRMAMIGLRKNLRAFEPFGNKLFGIHSRIPRHCGRGRRGKIFRLKPNENYLNRPINRTVMIGLRKKLCASAS